MNGENFATLPAVLELACLSLRPDSREARIACVTVLLGRELYAERIRTIWQSKHRWRRHSSEHPSHHQERRHPPNHQKGKHQYEGSRKRVEHSQVARCEEQRPCVTDR